MTTEDEPSILFYCKKCQKIILEPKQRGKKYEYACSECENDNLTFGTKDAIVNFYHIKEHALNQMLNPKSE